MFLLGIVSIGHFVVINIMFQEWLWLIGGLLFLPVTAVLWPLVAWFFGLAAGPTALIFYVAAAVAVALQTNADRESYR